MFAELFDQVIEARHNGFKKTDKHKTDCNPDNLTVLYHSGHRFGHMRLFWILVH